MTSYNIKETKIKKKRFYHAAAAAMVWLKATKDDTTRSSRTHLYILEGISLFTRRMHRLLVL